MSIFRPLRHALRLYLTEAKPCSWCGRRIWFWQPAAAGWRNDTGPADLWHRRCRRAYKADLDRRWPGFDNQPDDPWRPVRRTNASWRDEWAARRRSAAARFSHLRKSAWRALQALHPLRTKRD